MFLGKIPSLPRRPASLANEGALPHIGVVQRSNRTDAGADLERAYDALHRIHAILAYLNITKRPVPGISQFLEEAKHTYTQALSRYEAHDFAGAHEFAAACGCLSRVVEIVISRTLRSDTNYPSLVPPPPEHPSACNDSCGGQEDLFKEVESVLSRIHWLVENGTLPLEDRTQVRRITSWGDAFYQQTRRMYRSGSLEDAGELLQAANSAAHSAEHICRNWYVAQQFNP
jgi:hypothetical protein